MVLVARHRKDASLADLLAELFADPDEELVSDAIGFYPPFEPRMAERLRALLADPRPAVWSRAAVTLARRKDAAIGGVLRGWLRKGTREQFNVALSGLGFLLAPDEWAEALADLWDGGGRDVEDRVTLATMLLQAGDDRGVPLLVEVARGLGRLSIHAADTVFGYDATQGLLLMREILDRADAEIRWGMAERIAQRVNLPHRWTADAAAEARAWVEARLSGGGSG